MNGVDKYGCVPRILLVTGTLDGGGAERVLADMAAYWCRRSWKVTLATCTGPDVEDFYEVSAQVKRVWLDVDSPNNSTLSKVRSNIRRIIKLRKLLLEVKPHVALSFIDVPNIQTILAALGLDVRVVVSERHNPDQTEGKGRYLGAYKLSKPWPTLRRIVYRWADGVTALNSDAAEWIRKECHVQVTVIANPLRKLPEVKREREQLILGVGRLAKEKGFDLLLKAFSTIAAEFPDWRLIILGKGPEGASLKRLRDDLDLGDRADILNPTADVESWMARAGLMVLPSRFEAYGNAILEGLGMGAAVITTNCSGPASFVQDGVNGRLVPTEDVAALASAMSELMRRPEDRISLGREAVKVRETHRQDVIMRQWEEYLFAGLRCCSGIDLAE